jgi:hypothetical protein
MRTVTLYRLSGLAVLIGMAIEGIASILYSRAGGVALYHDPLVPADDLAGTDLLRPGHRDAPRCQVRIQGIGPSRPDDHVIAGQPGRIKPSPGQAEHQDVLHRMPGLTHDVNPLALRHAIHGPGDLATERRMNRLPPSVAIPRPPADQIPPQGPRRVQMKPAAVIGPDQVVGEPLAQHVGSVAWDPVSRRPLHQPLTTEGEIRNYRVVKLTHRSWPDFRSRLPSPAHLLVFPTSR